MVPLQVLTDGSFLFDQAYFVKPTMVDGFLLGRDVAPGTVLQGG
jgi:hypothetical protein